jgi:hypothetical protein
MPATRSQKAALASPLATTRKRSVSRAPSAEPPARKVSSRAPSKDLGLVVAETTTTTTMSTPGGTTARFTKRKHYQGSEADVEEEEEEEVEQAEVERPRKKQNTLKDQLFREEVQKRLAEKRAARAQELAAAKPKYPSSPAQLSRSEVLYGPGHSEQLVSPTPVAATAATPQRIAEQHQQQHEQQQPQQHLQQHHQPQQHAQPQQYPQLQPPQAQAQTPQRGFLGRLIETISPF